MKAHFEDLHLPGDGLRIPASDLWKPLTLLFQMEIVICSSDRHLW